MATGEDVIGVRWEASPSRRGRGFVIIEHDLSPPLRTPLEYSAARRLARRLLGSDCLEVPPGEAGASWVRRTMAEASSR